MIRFSDVGNLITGRQKPNHGQKRIQIEPETEPEKRVGNASKCRPFGGTKSIKNICFLVFSYEMVPRRGTKNGAGNEPEMEPEWSQNWDDSKPNHG